METIFWECYTYIFYHLNHFCREKQKLEFHEIENLNRVFHSYSTVPQKPAGMCTPLFTSSVLVYQDVSVVPNLVQSLDCSTLPLRLGGAITATLSQGTLPWHMCCVNDLLVGTTSEFGVFSYNTRSGQLIWRAQGKLEGMNMEMDAGGVTTDGHGHLFVCDYNNQCIQMFSINGVYEGALLLDTELGRPHWVAWCENSDSLIVLCQQKYYTSSVAKVNLYVIKIT